MPQLVLSEKDFVSDKILQIFLPSKLYLSSSEFYVGVCWLYVTFKQGGGARRILIGSDSVQAHQTIQNTKLIGSFRNKNNRRHFFSEANYPQFLGKVNKGNSFSVQLFNQDKNPIYLQEINHIGVCVVLKKSTMKEKNTLLSLTGELKNIGSDGNIMSYICTANIPQGIKIKQDSSVAITDIFLPKLTYTKDDISHNIIGDHESGLLHVSIFSNIVSYESDINSQLLRSFCIKVGHQNYTPPFLLYTLLTPGEYQSITFIMKVHTCEDLMRFIFKGNLEVNLIIKS